MTFDPLSEEEEEQDGRDTHADGGGLESEPELADPLHNALHKLASIMEVLTKDKVKKQSGSRLDQALDSVTSSSSEGQGLGAGKKSAVARRALRTIFQEHNECHYMTSPRSPESPSWVCE